MPIKRHQAIQPLSRDHHHGLLLCWKIREGFRRNIEPARMHDYARWFWKNHLVPHFEAEEEHLFPILEPDNELVGQALAEHRRLKALFEDEKNPTAALSAIEQELESHIRFEERVLFNAIQDHATPGQMQALEKLLDTEPSTAKWPDAFWTDLAK